MHSGALGGGGAGGGGLETTAQVGHSFFTFPLYFASNYSLLQWLNFHFFPLRICIREGYISYGGTHKLLYLRT